MKTRYRLDISHDLGQGKADHWNAFFYVYGGGTHSFEKIEPVVVAAKLMEILPKTVIEEMIRRPLSGNKTGWNWTGKRA